MIKGYEIERKFLVRMPDTAVLDVKRKLNIIQTYLVNGENNAQRRVRQISENGKVRYIYTEKLFITAVTRKEMEYEIDEPEYNRLIAQAREDYSPINKTRYCFDYASQLFELDVYPFSDSLAVMELELDSEEQEIIFPDNIEVIAEITGNPDYSNASLATAGAFPEQK
ncbi:MAG: CYTH domain-containing protein [Ruminococcus flavefaciens]|nr:CYTH domain-containing protein [Ruminococcus flavefaciens]